MRFSEIIQRQAVMLSKYLDGTNQKYKPYVSKW